MIYQYKEVSSHYKILIENVPTLFCSIGILMTISIYLSWRPEWVCSQLILLYTCGIDKQPALFICLLAYRKHGSCFKWLIHHFKNYYRRRHDRIVEIISNFIKESIWHYRINIDKHSTTVFPLLRDQLESIEHKKPDIHVVNHLEKKCFIVEITVCYDLYLEYARNTKYEKYKSMVECSSKNGYDVELLILWFGSLGSVRNDAWKCLKRFTNDKTYVKDVLKWCSLSSIIGSNYIEWRNYWSD